jgi:hypothetical protein
MSDQSVFCPKCGYQSPSDVRFCKRCGTNLEAVSRALTGAPTISGPVVSSSEVEVAYASELSRAIYHMLTSVTVFLVMLFLFRGAFWVWFMLFWVAASVRDVVQAYLLKQQIKDPVALQAALNAFKEEKRGKRRKRRRDREREALEAPQQPVSLPPPRTAAGDYIPPARTTGELVQPKEYAFDPDNPPPSVTEGTTRLLEEKPPPAADDQSYAPPSAVRQRE